MQRRRDRVQSRVSRTVIVLHLIDQDFPPRRCFDFFGLVDFGGRVGRRDDDVEPTLSEFVRRVDLKGLTKFSDGVIGLGLSE